MKAQVIIPGTVKAGKNAKGFNLNKFVKQLLQSIGFAVTTDCCTYFPTFPRLGTDFQSTDEVPNWGFFLRDTDNTTLYFRDGNGNIQEFVLD